MAVLVLDGHSRAALETVQSLGRERAPIHVAAESDDGVSLHSRYVRVRHQQPPPAPSEALLEWLRGLDGRYRFDLIVPATEASLLALNVTSDDDPLRVKAVLPPRRSLEIALDKQKTWSLAVRLGVPVAASILLGAGEDVPECTTYPVVLKPVFSKIMVEDKLVTVSAAIVKNGAQRLEWLRRWLPFTPVQQQAYISGRGVGVELLYDSGNKKWHFAHERVHELPLTGGASSYRRSIEPAAQLLRDSEALLDALHWHGVAMVEFKVDSSGAFWLMEINPRLWGSLALSIDAGVNFPLGLLRIARGEPLPPQPSYRRFYYTRDLSNDVQWMKSNLVADRRDPLLLTCPRLRSCLEYLRPLAGTESWDHFDWRDLALTGRIVRHIVGRELRWVRRAWDARRTARSLRRQHRRVVAALSASRANLRNILFLCYGNICRSPLAEALAAEAAPGCNTESAGFHPRVGRSCPSNMIDAARLRGIDMTGYRSRRVTHTDVDRADLILVMDPENLQSVAREFREALPRTTLLGLFARQPSVCIPDPYAASDEFTRGVIDQIDSSVQGVTNWLRHGTAPLSECTPALCRHQAPRG